MTSSAKLIDCLRKEVARHDLPQRKAERGETEQADERLLGAIPDLHHRSSASNASAGRAATSAETVATISGEIFDSFATWS